MSTRTAVGFLGAGQMATALAKGWTAAGLLDPERCVASDPMAGAREAFHSATGIKAVPSNAEVAKTSDVLILAVKPQTMSAVLMEVQPHCTPKHLIVSIAAGVTLAQLAAGLGEKTRLARVMPNMPCLVGASASGFAASTAATAEDVALVKSLFGSVGVAVQLPETSLDAVTGLSGSGPAFVYVMIEALADGGVRMGLPRDVALQLAAQTVLGSAKMVLETGKHPGVLKDAVASPGGTTIAGLHALERGGVRAALMDAVEAATKRATELGVKNT